MLQILSSIFMKFVYFHNEHRVSSEKITNQRKYVLAPDYKIFPEKATKIWIFF